MPTVYQQALIKVLLDAVCIIANLTTELFMCKTSMTEVGIAVWFED